LKKTQENVSSGNYKALFPLPEPIELAKIAAVLPPSYAPSAAVEKAMELYVEATLFVGELPQDGTVDEFIERFGSEARNNDRIRRGFGAILAGQESDTLELDANKDNDPNKDEARRFLAERGLRLYKTTRAVLAIVRRYYQRPRVAGSVIPDKASITALIDGYKNAKRGTHNFPRTILAWAASYATQRSSEANRKGHVTRKQKSAKKKSVKKNRAAMRRHTIRQ
jgi:hypothetical protein